MRVLLWNCGKRVLSWFKRGVPKKEIQVDIAETDRIMAREKKRLEEQEVITRRQQREFEETQARIRYLRTQLDMLGNGGNHRSELD